MLTRRFLFVPSCRASVPFNLERVNNCFFGKQPTVRRWGIAVAWPKWFTYPKKRKNPPEVVTYFRGFVLFVRNMTHFIILLLPDGIIAYAVLKCNIVKRKNCPALPAISPDCAANGTEKNRCKTENADFKQRLQQLRRKHNKKVLNRVELCRGFCPWRHKRQSFYAAAAFPWCHQKNCIYYHHNWSQRLTRPQVCSRHKKNRH